MEAPAWLRAPLHVQKLGIKEMNNLDDLIEFYEHFRTNDTEISKEFDDDKRQKLCELARDKIHFIALDKEEKVMNKIRHLEEVLEETGDEFERNKETIEKLLSEIDDLRELILCEDHHENC